MMKTETKYVWRIWSIILLLLLSITSYAYDFKVGGLCYNILDTRKKTVELTWEAIRTPYTGNIVVPSQVSFNGVTYDVVEIGRIAMVNVLSINDSGVVSSWEGNDKLCTVSLPSSIIVINDCAFDNCSGLTSIAIPKSVTTIGADAFESCSALTSIKVDDRNSKYDSRNDCNAIIETASNLLIAGCKNTIIPNSVTSIGDNAFCGCNGLTSINIPNSVASLGNFAFYGCSSLTSITIPSSVTSIGRGVFQGCNGLISVTLPHSVTSIGGSAFQYCSLLTSVTIPNGVTSIADFTFCGCSSLTSITIPDNVKSIGKYAFKGCNGLTSITIPNSVTNIGNYAFSDCSGLAYVKIEKDTPISISPDVFSNRMYKTLYVPKGSKAAYQSAAYWKEFKEIVEYATSSTYSLSITSSTGGSVNYAGDAITGTTQSYTVDEGTNATLTFTPNSGYRLKSVVVNGADVSASVVNNQYTVSNISQNTTVNVAFEAIPPTTYTLTISSSGGGDVTYYENVIPGNVISNGTTQSYTVNKGGSANLTFMPNSGYRLKSVVVNGVDITASVVNNQYTISSISQNTTVNVTYEAIPQYTLNLVASGNGDVKYKSITIRNKSQEWVNIPEGYSLTFELIPDEGYRVASVKENNKDVTSSIVDNLYTVSNIKEDKRLEVLFEVIPPTTYSLSITSSTGGSVTYSGNAISGTTKSYTVNAGTPASLTFTPNSGYRLKNVVVNGVDVTASVVNNKYTISDINKNTMVNVMFEVIPQTTYTLTVLLSGDGTVNCNDVTVYSSYKFNVNEGTSQTLTFTPNSGYRLKSVVVNSIDVTASVVNNQYTVSNVNQNTTIDVTFEVIPPNTYTLTILSSGGGTISHNGIMVYSTNKFEVDEGTSHTLTFTPNSGYRLKSVVVNGVDVTASVVNNQYTISSIRQNTTVKVTFEVIPLTTYTLTVLLSGDGTVSCNDVTVYSSYKFNFNEGTSHTLTITPNSGYRLMSVVVDGTDVTASVVNNQYSINNISQNTTVVVMFEEIPPTTYTLSITADGGGYVTFSGNTISGTTKSYTVDEGTSHILTFTPNSGYRLKSVVVNGVDVTANVVNNQYTISDIRQNITVNMVFEVIPPTTYILSITADGGGYVNYQEASVSFSWQTKVFTVNKGAAATLSFTSNSGYRLKSVVVNGGDVTASVVNDQYTIYSISQNTSVSVTFEEIPPTTYILSITADGSGNVLYSGYSIYGTRNFTVNEKTSHTLTFTPNSGYRLKSVVVNGVDVTANVVNNQYTVSDISQNTTVEVTFVEELKAMTVSGVNYTVTSYDGKTVKVAAGDYGKVLTVPLSFDYDGETWMVDGIESGALANNEKLAAIIWNPFVTFTENPVNPNLLLYVKSASYAPSSVNNVIVNNVAQKITLEESDSDNDFYCPLAFTARSISYSHSYQMTTGIDKCQGWETIALPFDVQTISHGTKGVIVPFAAKTGNSQKAFWLYELTNNGWRAASAVKANTPYIISMPNNDLYYDNARLNGRITFSATDVTVPVTNANSVTYQGRTFTANFEHQQKSRSLFTLNVNNELYSNTSGDEGSQFVAAKRDASPFEAYMTTTNNARTSFGIFEDTSTEIRGIEELIDAKRVNVYNLNGQKRKTAGDESIDELKRRLPAGVYIMNGQKVIVR